jgi:hypothetical protein
MSARMAREAIARAKAHGIGAGIILPMAEHKGYAIAVVMDVLSGLLSGSSFGSTVNGPCVADKPSGCGLLKRLRRG